MRYKLELMAAAAIFAVSIWAVLVIFAYITLASVGLIQ
jgi:hypothetical protein